VVTPAERLPARPAKQKSGTGWKVATLIFALLLAFSLLVHLSGFFSALVSGGSGMAADSHLQEVVVEYNRADDKIAVVPIEGVIAGGSGMSPHDLVKLVEGQLKLAGKDRNVKAVVLKVNSPGGEVLASDDIYNLITRFQTNYNKPIIASMGSLAASGGYYVSAPCRWIVANELTITGSIGVIMQTYNIRGLMNKVGVRPLVYKSGRFKDMLSFSKDLEQLTPEEKSDLVEEEAMMRKLINETFARFKTVIVEGRQRAQAKNAKGSEPGRALSSEWQNFADGRILSGTEAFQLGLVDELGNWETAVRRARTLAGITNANLVAYQPPFDLGSLFRIFGKSDAKGVKIDLGLELPRIQPGLHYLAEAFMR